jgi:hypothetical protein
MATPKGRKIRLIDINYMPMVDHYQPMCLSAQSSDKPARLNAGLAGL